MVRRQLRLLEGFEDPHKKLDWDHGYRHAVRGQARKPKKTRGVSCGPKRKSCYDTGYESGKLTRSGRREPVHMGKKSPENRIDALNNLAAKPKLTARDIRKAKMYASSVPHDDEFYRKADDILKILKDRFAAQLGY